MMTTSSMELLSVVVFKEQADAAASRLVYSGFFHPIDLRDFEGAIGSSLPALVEKERAQWEDIGFKLSGFSEVLGLELPLNRDPGQFSFLKIKDFYEELNFRLSPFIKERQEIYNRLKSNREIISLMMEELPASLKANSQYTFLEVDLGMIKKNNLQVLESGLSQIPCVIHPVRRQADDIVILVIALKSDRELVRKVLSVSVWKSMEDLQDGKFSKDMELEISRGIQQDQIKLDFIEAKLKVSAPR